MHYDVVIIGGGPCGSSAGSLLARAGKKVLVLEREIFPRFHIGESLIPFGNDVLREMGVWDKLVDAGFMPKWGAEFTVTNSCGFQRFWFRNNVGPQHAQTFQVERAKFDKLLLDHAGESGCEVRQGCRVSDATVNPEGATIRFESESGPQTVTSSWLFDATGRDAFLGKKLSLKKSSLDLPKKIAVYSHFEGVYRNEGEAEGHITIVRLEAGWLWIIPLDAQKTSVGMVSELASHQKFQGTPEEYFWNAVKNSPEMQFRFKNARSVCEFRVTHDYTYRHFQCAGPRWFLAGDAAGFIDPIFSSGVMVALRTGRLAAETVLRSGNQPLTETQQKKYTDQVHQMTGVFLRMIRMFYDNDAFSVFMNPRPLWKLNQTVNQLVAGRTEMSFIFWLRVQLFFLICRLQKRWPIAPQVSFQIQPKAG